MRDVALNLFWTNRFAMTMYEKRPTRWRDVPRAATTCSCRCWRRGRTRSARWTPCRRASPRCRPTWDPQVEDRIFRVLFDVLRHRRFHATELPADQTHCGRAARRAGPADLLAGAYDPDYPVYGYQQILDCAEDVPELEALHRWAMVLHDQYPWDRGQTRLTPVGELRDDDYVVVFHPRNRDVLDFIRRMRRDGAAPRPVAAAPPTLRRSPPSRRCARSRRCGCGSGSPCCRDSRRSRW